MMTKPIQDDIHDEWEACAAGDIQRMVGRERSRRMVRRLSRAASGVAVVAVLVIGTVVGGRYWFRQQTQPAVPESLEHMVAGINCGDVIKHLPAYVNDTLHREDPEINELVFHHLQKCRRCDARKKELMEASAAMRNGEPSVARLENNAARLFARQPR